MEPLVSVIVPIYKVEAYLRQCIDSILNQSYRNLEIILVDDGSPDRCGEICDEYAKLDTRVKVIHKQNSGLADARNIGIKQATGQYIAFVDGDDWIDLDYYTYLCASIQDCDMLICGYKSVDEQGKQIESCIFEERVVDTEYDEISISLENLMSKSALGFVWNKLYKSEIIKSVEFEQLMPREDIVFNLIVISNVKKLKLTGTYTGYNWAQHPSSITHSIGSSYVDKTLRINDRLFEIMQISNLKCKWSIYDCIMKVLLADTILVGIVGNVSLDKKEKKALLHKLIKCGDIRKNLKFKMQDSFYYQMLWLCFKLKLSSALYYLSIMALKR